MGKIVWVLIINIPYNGMIFQEITGNREIYLTEQRCERAEQKRLDYFKVQESAPDARPDLHVADIAAKAMECVRFEVVR
jgi:hypothetical protein